MRRRKWMAWLGVAALAAAGAGLAGCEDEDGEDADAVPVVVVTNVVGGTVVTNVAPAPAQTNAVAAEEEEAPAADILEVAGKWNGVIAVSGGSTMHMDLELNQNGTAISGTAAFMKDGHRAAYPATGTLAGDQLNLELTRGARVVSLDDLRISMVGFVNASATAYEGTWSGGISRGTFALQK